MKYLFGTNATKGIKTGEPDGQRYRKIELPHVIQKELDRQENAVARASKRDAMHSGTLGSIKWACLAFGAAIASGILKTRVPLAQVYQNRPLLFWIAGILIAAAGVLFALEKASQKRGRMTPALTKAQKDYEAAERQAKSFLFIPDDAKTVDILMFSYRDKDGQAKIKAPALNLALQMYLQDDLLCLSEGASVYAIPKGKLTALRLIERSVAVLGWNKKENPNQSRFKKAGPVMQQNEPAGLRFYCALEWIDAGETWQLLFPAYERAKLESLTGLQTPKLPENVTEKKVPASKQEHYGKVRPRFYWTVPKEENAAFWFSSLSDVTFKLAHPKLYGILTVLGIILLCLPMFVFIFVKIKLLPYVNSPLILLGGAGGFVMGIGLFNLVAAWLEQYLGHWVTILCLVLGAAMMAASWLLMC